MTRTAILIAMMLAAAPASAADWPQWLGPNRDGVSPETTWLADRPDPKEIWRASVGLGPSSPVVAGGRCCVMGYTGGLEDPHGTDTVWCLDAETGEIAWKHSYDCKGCESQDVKFAGPRATPTVDGNAVYWKGHLYGFDNRGTDYSKQDDKKSSLKCLDFATGEEKWSRAGMGWGNLILADGKLIVLREGGEVVVAEATPAEYRERSRTPVLRGPCWTVPALAGGRLYLRSNAGDVVCLDVRAP